MKAKVDADTCIGCGLCAATCPAVFKMEDGKSVVIVEVVPQEHEERCKQAAEECPVTAIEVN